MFTSFAWKNRPYHLGPLPAERLARSSSAPAEWPDEIAPPDLSTPLGPSLSHYLDLYARLRAGTVAPDPAPVPNDPARRAADVKGYAYFLDATQVAIGPGPQPNCHSIAILVEWPTLPDPDAKGGNQLARDWLGGSAHGLATLHAAEIGLCLANYIRLLGWRAQAHWPGQSEIALSQAATVAGLVLPKGGRATSPFVGHQFSLAVVVTDYVLAHDRPLSPSARVDLGWWLGWGGSTSRLERMRRQRRLRRTPHLSRFPTETLKRRRRPTTRIDDDKVARVAKRAAFFERAKWGDLGDKAKRERGRFAFKTPTAQALMPLLSAIVPHQSGQTAAQRAGAPPDDPAALAKAIKALGHALGADMTGVAPLPDYAWFSHQADGTPITPYHSKAAAMIIDQGYDTMEGASGDDWISGVQSMRAYLRGARIAGVMADFLRRQGIPARSHTNADSDLLHIPVLLWAGLGELSRIGELVLNPFLGPRFKSVVLSFEAPVTVDQPIDFGLQEFCGDCQKCARECPCDAIPMGGKVMFNGYEIWKPDVERCTRYRLTNMKGAACGRCMKTCPLNKVVDWDGPWHARIASWIGLHTRLVKRWIRPYAIRWDDTMGNGRRILTKKWWLDLEMVDDRVVEPQKGTNERDLQPDKPTDPARQKIATYTPDMNPAPDAQQAVPLDRKAALDKTGDLERP